MRRICGVITEASVGNIIIGGHEDSRNTLIAIHDNFNTLKCSSYKSPLTATGVAISYNTKTELVDGRNLPLDAGVDSLVGSKAIVWAYARSYKFVSTYDSNKGEIIYGWSMRATRIKKTDNF